MLRLIIATSLRFRFIIIAAAAGLMFFGLGQIRNMPVDVFPEFAPPKVEVQTITLGLSAAEVESLVTVPLEQALAGVEGLDILRSKSVAQLSQIEMIFKPGTDLLKARQLVQERINGITGTLPTWASPPFIMQPLSATSRVMKIGLSSDTVDLLDLSSMSYWTIRARLLGVPGVANVMIYGERLEQMHVQVIPEKLEEHGVSIAAVMEATSEALDEGILMFSEANAFGTGGWIETANQRLSVIHPPSVRSAEDLAHVAVQGMDGKLVNLDEVALLVRDHQPLHGEAVINDGQGSC